MCTGALATSDERRGCHHRRRRRSKGEVYGHAEVFRNAHELETPPVEGVGPATVLTSADSIASGWRARSTATTRSSLRVAGLRSQCRGEQAATGSGSSVPRGADSTPACTVYLPASEAQRPDAATLQEVSGHPARRALRGPRRTPTDSSSGWVHHGQHFPRARGSIVVKDSSTPEPLYSVHRQTNRRDEVDSEFIGPLRSRLPTPGPPSGPLSSPRPARRHRVFR